MKQRYWLPPLEIGLQPDMTWAASASWANSQGFEITVGVAGKPSPTIAAAHLMEKLAREHVVGRLSLEDTPLSEVGT